MLNKCESEQGEPVRVCLQTVMDVLQRNIFPLTAAGTRLLTVAIKTFSV